MKKLYHTILPERADTIEKEWSQCLHKLKELPTDVLKIFKIVIFVDTKNNQSYYNTLKYVSTSIQSQFGNKTPAFTVLGEAPESPFKISVETGMVNISQSQIHYHCLNGRNYTVIESGVSKELWASGMGTDQEITSIEMSSVAAFEETKQILAAEKFSFNHIVRQWNYIARIVDFDKVGENQFQHYQIFNEIRNQYYHKFRTIKGYPAATGIGTTAGGVSIDFCAILHADEKHAISIQNPGQANPYLYGQEELQGSVLTGKTCKQAPQFERGKLIIADDITLYVSGTASIIGQKTIGINDIELQTRTTIDNILKLSSAENLENHGAKNHQIPTRVCILRTYIKYPEHFNVVKQICKESFGNVPAVYVLADVCRPDLLVEIEAEFGM